METVWKRIIRIKKGPDGPFYLAHDRQQVCRLTIYVTVTLFHALQH